MCGIEKANHNMDTKFVTLLFLIVPLASGMCPDDWNDRESLCYKFSSFPINWYNAREVGLVVGKCLQFALYQKLITFFISIA